MKINEVSNRLKIPKSMIRYYEEKELIEIPRDENNYRYFDRKTISYLKLIIDLKKLNLQLKDIAYVIDLFKQPISKNCNNKTLNYLDQLIEQIKLDIERQNLILKRLESVKFLSKDMNYEKNKNLILKKLSGVEEID
ncbi:MerR family transcriptional regulator [Staphylococcus caprae]|uniref:MerR family transcriptional regulator n=1 Tax=Staphylococcus caprae TaxID=29380 RepID=UPI003B2121AC